MQSYEKLDLHQSKETIYAWSTNYLYELLNYYQL